MQSYRMSTQSWQDESINCEWNSSNYLKTIKVIVTRPEANRRSWCHPAWHPLRSALHKRTINSSDRFDNMQSIQWSWKHGIKQKLSDAVCACAHHVIMNDHVIVYMHANTEDGSERVGMRIWHLKARVSVEDGDLKFGSESVRVREWGMRIWMKKEGGEWGFEIWKWEWELGWEMRVCMKERGKWSS